MAWSDVDWMPASCAAGPLDIGRRSLRLWPNPGQGGGLASASDRRLSATLQSEADPTIENGATGSWLLVCGVVGSDAGQGVDSAVA